MSKKLFYFAVVILVIIGVVFLISKKPLLHNQTSNSSKLQVVTTLYPLYDFVRNIGQDKVEVLLLLPPGVEAHSFEPKPSDIVKINESDLFVYTGKFMEPWAEDIIKGISGKDVKVVDTSAGIELMKEGEHEHEHEYHHHGGVDPHIWLDFDNTQVMVDNITQGLVEKDPNNKDFYLANAASYKKSLQELDKKYKTTLTTCRTKEVVYGGHYAFGYLAKRYGLNYVAAQGIAPDSEPTANDMISLVKQIKTNGIKYVFYEELTSPKISQTLSKETGTQMLLLNAAHNVTKQDLNNGVSYLSIMEENLINLKTGLECQ